MSFWGDFTGSTAKKATRNAKAASDKQLDQGLTTANTYYDQARAGQDPYAQQGLQGFNTYNQAIGLGTPQQQGAAQDLYFNDGVQQKIANQNSNALLRNLNARGQSGGGMAALAGQRVGLEGYNGWLNRLQGVGAQGQQAASTQSNINLGQGDLNWGAAATKAGSEINYGNAQAQNSGIFSNNLLNLAGTAAKAFAGFK